MKYSPIIFLLSCTFFSHAQSIETVIQKGHELAVLTVAVSPDSNYVATGSRDKSAKLWELSTGREVRSFLGHTASVISLEFSRDGKYLLTGSGDNSARIWEVATGKEIFSVQPDEERVTDVTFDPMGKFFVTVGFGRKAIVWGFPSKKKIKELPADGYAGSGGLIHLAISPNGEWLAIGEDNSVANVYKVATWEKTFTFNFSEYSSCGGCFTDVYFSPDSKYLVKATNRGEVARYSLTNGQRAAVYRKKVEDLKSVQLSRDGKQVVLCTEKYVTIYNTEKGDSLKTINPNMEAEINQAAFSADGKRVLLACDNNTVQIWDIAKSTKVGELTGFLNQRDKGGLTYDPNSYWASNIAKYVRFKNNLLLSRDNKTLLKGKFGTKAKRWDIATGKTEMEYVGHDKAVLCYQYSRDGKKLVTGGGDGTVIIWSAEKGDTIRTIKTYREPVFDVQFSNDESKIVSTSWEGLLKIHNATTGKRLEYFTIESGSIYHVLFSRNDLYLITASLPTGLQMREIDTQKIIREFVGHTETVSSIRLTQDGKKLLSASWDGSVRLWDIATGLADRKFSEHKGSVYAAIFNNSEKAVFSAGADRVIRMWDVATGKTIKTFVGHQSEVSSLQLTTDEKMLVSNSVDGVTKFWDLNSGKEFFEHIHFGEKEWMVKSPEGYFNGTQEARRFIHFVDGLKTYSVDQFFDEFYRPDLLPKIFQSRGGNDDYKDIQGKLQKSPPPSVKVAAIASSDLSKAEVFVKILDNGGGVDNLKLFHNGKSVTIDKASLKLPNGKDQTTTYRHVVSLIGGTNTFSATAVNKDKIESDPNSAELFSEQTGRTSTCYILAVGINQYKNPRMTLNYAKPDAESFTKVMDEKGKLFKNVDMHTLYDTEASRVNILKALDEISTKVHQEDVFIFYYAGHGSMVDNQFFFIPTESSRLYDYSSLQKEALEASVLQDKFKNIKALKQLIVMDACQSGASVELLANRGAAEEKAIAQLSRSAGIHVMASAGSEQFATEFAELGHGLFTYLLIKALQGDADGAPKDGKVTIYELKSYLDDQVPEMTRKLKGKPQYPYTFSRGQDFPVVIEN
jgi:WD40 repeat protein